jgi:hypothetical protein
MHPQCLGELSNYQSPHVTYQHTLEVPRLGKQTDRNTCKVLWLVIMKWSDNSWAAVLVKGPGNMIDPIEDWNLKIRNKTKSWCGSSSGKNYRVRFVWKAVKMNRMSVEIWEVCRMTASDGVCVSVLWWTDTPQHASSSVWSPQYASYEIPRGAFCVKSC